MTTHPTTMSLAEAAERGFRVPERLTAPPGLSQRHPALYALAVRVMRHASLLLRELAEDEATARL